MTDSPPWPVPGLPDETVSRGRVKAESEPVRRRGPLRVARGGARLLMVGLLVLGSSAAFSGAARWAPLTAAARPHQATASKGPLSRFDAWAEQGDLRLPPSTEATAPAPADLGPPLRAHELFGFAPYWTLAESGGFDVSKLSTIAYFGVDCSPDGSLQAGGPGWTGFESEALTQLITRAHRAGERVVLTVKCFDNGAIHAIVSDPAAVDRLAASAIQAVQSRSLDGVNVDFESTDGSDREAFTRTVAALSGVMHAANPQWQVTVDTYGSSAGDPANVFDVAALASVVDGLFVMAYDMNHGNAPAPTAPLAGYSSNDTAVIAAYTSVAPAAKLVLGTPFYGYDWVSAGPDAGSAATGAPLPQTYAEVMAGAHPGYWDSQGSVPWTAYLDDQQQWHQTWYDNALSLALKARLATHEHLGGLGIWALGMEGSDTAMIDALRGAPGPLAAALKEESSGPAPPVASAGAPAPAGPVPPPAATQAGPAPGGAPVVPSAAGPTPVARPNPPAPTSPPAGASSPPSAGPTPTPTPAPPPPRPPSPPPTLPPAPTPGLPLGL